jgi:hypothetical protein
MASGFVPKHLVWSVELAQHRINIGLQVQRVLQHTDYVRTILIYPSPIVLSDHIPVRMPHLLSDPID